MPKRTSSKSPHSNQILALATPMWTKDGPFWHEEAHYFVVRLGSASVLWPLLIIHGRQRRDRLQGLWVFCSNPLPAAATWRSQNEHLIWFAVLSKFACDGNTTCNELHHDFLLSPFVLQTSLFPLLLGLVLFSLHLFTDICLPFSFLPLSMPPFLPSISPSFIPPFPSSFLPSFLLPSCLPPFLPSLAPSQPPVFFSLILLYSFLLSLSRHFCLPLSGLFVSFFMLLYAAPFLCYGPRGSRWYHGCYPDCNICHAIQRESLFHSQVLRLTLLWGLRKLIVFRSIRNQIFHMPGLPQHIISTSWKLHACPYCGAQGRFFLQNGRGR